MDGKLGLGDVTRPVPGTTERGGPELTPFVPLSPFGAFTIGVGGTRGNWSARSDPELDITGFQNIQKQLGQFYEELTAGRMGPPMPSQLHSLLLLGRGRLTASLGQPAADEKWPSAAHSGDLRGAALVFRGSRCGPEPSYVPEGPETCPLPILNLSAIISKMGRILPVPLGATCEILGSLHKGIHS